MGTAKRNVLIIGGGEIGIAIYKLISKKKDLRVVIWDRRKKKSTTRLSLEELLPKSDFIFFCIPSWAVPEVLIKIHKLIGKQTVLVVLSKGMLKSGVTLDVFLSGFSSQYAFLGGPMLAEELLAGKAGFGILGSPNIKIFQKVARLFEKSALQLEYSDDVKGIVLSGILKNIYAIALGIADGMKMGCNFKGWLTKTILEEMREIVAMLGGQEKTVYTTAGLGDLVATGFSSYSTNFMVGRKLAASSKTTINSEGVRSALVLQSILQKRRKSKKFLIFWSVVRIVKGRNAKEVFKKAFQKR